MRLKFFDRVQFDNCFRKYKYNLDTVPNLFSEEQDNFISNLLDSDLDFSEPSMRSTFTYVMTFIGDGKYPSQKILNRLLIICFEHPSFVNQFILIANKINVQGWIYFAFARLIKSKEREFNKSLIEDNPIWDWILDQFENEINSTEKFDPLKEYTDRDQNFMIEAIPHYWPMEKVSDLTMVKLISSVSVFCIDHKNKSTSRLLSLLYTILPKCAAKLPLTGFSMLNARAIFEVMRTGIEVLIPDDIEAQSQHSLKLLSFNIAEAKRIAEEIGNSDILEIINHYNPAEREVIFG